MKNRPGEHARLKIRAGWRRALRKHLSLWISLIVVVISSIVLVVVVPMPSAMRGFWIGFVLAAGLAGFAWMLQILSNTHGWSMGKVGEEATAEAVASWRRRRKGWRLINGIYVAGHGDIDHVLVGPGGVFVIESKWTTKTCRIEHGSVKGLVGREPVSQARTGAGNVERLLLQNGFSLADGIVRPVVVLWGPGRVHLADGWKDVGDVLVCEGPRKKLWLGELAGHVIGQEESQEVARVLEEQVIRQVDRADGRRISSTLH